MFNEISPAVYSRLRERAGLTQAQLSSILGLSRATVINVELGRSQLHPDDERRLIELADCSREEFAELACQQLSVFLKKQVCIRQEAEIYEPTTALGRARKTVSDHGLSLPTTLMRALNSRIHSTQLLGLAFERNNADLEELARDCLEEVTEKETGRES